MSSCKGFESETRAGRVYLVASRYFAIDRVPYSFVIVDSLGELGELGESEKLRSVVGCKRFRGVGHSESESVVLNLELVPAQSKTSKERLRYQDVSASHL